MGFLTNNIGQASTWKVLLAVAVTMIVVSFAWNMMASKMNTQQDGE
jgi:hypothetical protein